MLRERTLVAALLLPIALLVIHFGGLFYSTIITFLLLIAAWEYIKLLQVMGFQPSSGIILGGIFILTQSRVFLDFRMADLILTLILFSVVTSQLLSYEKEGEKTGGDLGTTFSVILYIGWLGSYLISLRNSSLGMWWTYLILSIVWLSDTGAYLLGTKFGKRKLSPRLSPNKTWEGYIGGILLGVLGSVGLVFLFENQLSSGINLTLIEGGVLGLIISSLIPLGDLAESMIKRQAGVKDSGHLFPGHGGMFDRLDTLIWAAPTGFYLLNYLIPFLKNL